MKSGGLRAVIIIVGILLVLSVLYLVSAFVQIPYTGYAVYTEKEPYTETETYLDTEPYTDQDCSEADLKSVIELDDTDSVCINEICDSNTQVCVDTNWYGGCIKYQDQCTHKACTKYKLMCKVSVQNIDDNYGVWVISGYEYFYNTRQRGDLIKDIQVPVQPTKTGMASWEYTFDAGESVGCSYDVKTTPTKSVCRDIIKTKNVEKTREVTKYKDVEKQRAETKYCSVWEKIINEC